MKNFRTREKRREFFLKSFSENCETEEKSKTYGRTTLEYAHTHKKNEEKWTLSGDSEDCLRIMSQPFLLLETSPKLLFFMHPRSARIPYMFVNAREIIPWCLQVLPRPGVALVQYFIHSCKCKSNNKYYFAHRVFSMCFHIDKTGTQLPDFGSQSQVNTIHRSEPRYENWIWFEYSFSHHLFV